MIQPKYVIVAVVSAVMFSGGYLTGKKTSPTRIVTVEKRVEIEKQTIVQQQKIDVAELMRQVQEVAKRNNVHREVVVERRADGTVTRRETSDDRSTTDSKTDRVASTTAHAETETKIWKETVRIEEHTKIVERLRAPDGWALGAQVGYALPSLGGSSPTFSLLPGPYRSLLLGVSLDRRLFGPFWTGVWVNSHGDAGLALKIVW